ncbi:MAG: hypothetical protein B7Z66_03530 [Chromatiales bacterium 21-64-14]|nr:MAG: hypothetical protein B7Z66_03530 [Chromatiales bacterium 21-64-14]HQU14851.1 type II secretion system protein M [Gammaproteobacteria bacterium]
MKEWLAARTPRERQILIIGAALLAVLLLYGVVLRPFHNRLATLRHNVDEQRALLHWMHGAAGQIQALRGSAGNRVSGQPILSLVDQTARQEQLGNAVKRLEPDSSGGVRVWLEQAPFDQVVQWLGKLERDHGLQLESITVESTGVPGQVSGRAVLQGGG